MTICFFRAIKHLLDVLTPHSVENGGPLKLDHAVFVEGRGNLIIEYSPEGATGTLLKDSTVSIVMSNLVNFTHQVQLHLLALILMLSLLTLRPGRGTPSSW